MPTRQPTLCLSLATLVPRSPPSRGGRNARVMQRHRRIVIPGEPTCETRDPGTQAKEVYWVPALQNCARAISPAGMTNDGTRTRQPTLCLSLATPRSSIPAFAGRPERAEDAAPPEDCHPGRAHLRDPGPRNAGEGSLLGPGSPKLRTRNFSGRDDKRWNAHAPTDSLLVACDSRSSIPAFAGRPERAGDAAPPVLRAWRQAPQRGVATHKQRELQGAI